MCSDIELTYENMGLIWRVDVIEEDRCLDTVVSVSVWDGRTYSEVEADTTRFAIDNEDILNQEIENYYTNLRAVHEDRTYEIAREEGRI